MYKRRARLQILIPVHLEGTLCNMIHSGRSKYLLPTHKGKTTNVQEVIKVLYEKTRRFPSG